MSNLSVKASFNQPSNSSSTNISQIKVVDKDKTDKVVSSPVTQPGSIKSISSAKGTQKELVHVKSETKI